MITQPKTPFGILIEYILNNAEAAGYLKAKDIREELGIPTRTFKKYTSKIRKRFPSIGIDLDPEDDRKIIFFVKSSKSHVFPAEAQIVPRSCPDIAPIVPIKSSKTATRATLTNLVENDEKNMRYIKDKRNSKHVFFHSQKIEQEGGLKIEDKIQRAKFNPLEVLRRQEFLKAQNSGVKNPSGESQKESSSQDFGIPTRRGKKALKGKSKSKSEPNELDEFIDVDSGDPLPVAIRKKKNASSAHKFERQMYLDLADQCHHIHYYDYSPEERTFEFAKTFDEIYTGMFLTTGYWSLDVAFGPDFFCNSKRYKYYRRARIAADTVGADYAGYIKAQIERFQLCPIKYPNKKTKTMEEKSLPAPRDLATDLCIQTYLGWMTNNVHPTTPPLARNHRDPELWAMNYDSRNPTERQIKYWKTVMKLIERWAKINQKSVKEMVKNFVFMGVFPPEFFGSERSGYQEIGHEV